MDDPPPPLVSPPPDALLAPAPPPAQAADFAAVPPQRLEYPDRRHNRSMLVVPVVSVCVCVVVSACKYISGMSRDSAAESRRGGGGEILGDRSSLFIRDDASCARGSSSDLIPSTPAHHTHAGTHAGSQHALAMVVSLIHFILNQSNTISTERRIAMESSGTESAAAAAAGSGSEGGSQHRPFIGVLALQGAFHEHAKILQELGVRSQEVRAHVYERGCCRARIDREWGLGMPSQSSRLPRWSIIDCTGAAPRGAGGSGRAHHPRCECGARGLLGHPVIVWTAGVSNHPWATHTHARLFYFQAESRPPWPSWGSSTASSQSSSPSWRAANRCVCVCVYDYDVHASSLCRDTDPRDAHMIY